ncbi:MAG TPA: 2Fe-2S iron-sulfur cluster-binding protein [Caulobacteraceae bacterium]|jgi:sarcosine oxidase subunit alpha|nr:2Fe-2S iron-sulfur cluster-binding protein [Caulobacteraceae bacterium]
MNGGRFDAGGRIDRARPIGFSFEGRAYRGFAGDTLASALLANGVRLAGRSFKLHRPRGVIAAGVEEPNAIVDVIAPGDRRPNLRATEVELCDGLAAVPTNCWPSLAFDAGAINGLMARFIPAGFYYKTFLWPRWRVFEPFIRRAAGLGRAARTPVGTRFEHRFAHCDVLVVGGGRAGLAAAAEAAAASARVILCEQDTEFGGQLLWNGQTIEGRPGPDWAGDQAAAIAGAPGSAALARTTAIGAYDHGAVALAERLADGRVRLWTLRAGRMVLATGATERLAVFPGNDRPGVMLAGAALQYQERFAVRLARRAVVFTNNDAAYATAMALACRGAKTTLVDARPVTASVDVAGLVEAGVEMLNRTDVVATHGGQTLAGVTVRGADGGERSIDCELLAVSAGFTPNLQLFTQAGGRLAYEGDTASFRPAAPLETVSVVGSAAGHGLPPTQAPRRIAGRGKAFVDLQNDVAVDDIALAAQEGMVSIEHLKRYTALGMGTDQGRTSGFNGQAILGEFTGRSIEAVGATRPRPPVSPVPLGAFAGRGRGPLFHPLRRSPLQAMHQGLGAALEDYGGWLRPACYPAPGESEAAAVQREALAVRGGVGLFDSSPLGKIEVVGPDAGRFIDRIYANAMSSLAIGRARYGLMLSELGVIVDDGVVLRLAEDHFLVGTTTGGAERIAGWLEEWRQCEWPGLRVLVAPVTTAWGVVTVSGPAARQALQSAGTDIDLSDEAFPHMSVRAGRVAGLPARVARVSFTGEVSYEVNVPTTGAETLWNALAGATGEPRPVPVGVEAWLLLRLEKGFLHVGMDTDGTTTPADVGFGHVARRKVDFVGKRSLTRPDNLRPGRHQLVALEALSGAAMAVGAHLTGSDGRGSEGFVTSAGWSPTLARPVALAMVKDGLGRMGERLSLAGEGRAASVRIVERGAYDRPVEARNG